MNCVIYANMDYNANGCYRLVLACINQTMQEPDWKDMLRWVKYCNNDYEEEKVKASVKIKKERLTFLNGKLVGRTLGIESNSLDNIVKQAIKMNTI